MVMPVTAVEPILDLVPRYKVMMTSMNGLTRGQLAKACNMGPETIRFYEREGLLPLPDRTAAGYRSFSTETVHRLNFIQRAKNLGFSLREIKNSKALPA